MKKIFLLSLLLLMPFMLSGCVSSEYASNLEYKIEELEEEITDLKSENEELKEKLEDIQAVAVLRDEDYNDLLDEIEQKSLY